MGHYFLDLKYIANISKNLKFCSGRGWRESGVWGEGHVLRPLQLRPLVRGRVQVQAGGGEGGYHASSQVCVTGRPQWHHNKVRSLLIMCYWINLVTPQSSCYYYALQYHYLVSFSQSPISLSLPHSFSLRPMALKCSMLQFEPMILISTYFLSAAISSWDEDIRLKGTDGFFFYNSTFCFDNIQP